MTTTLYYLRKRDPRQPIWNWATPERARREPIPWPLVELAMAAEDHILTNREDARRVLDYLKGLEFSYDYSRSPRTPVEVVDLDDNPVTL
jgi:hypothetical protein